MINTLDFVSRPVYLAICPFEQVHGSYGLGNSGYNALSSAGRLGLRGAEHAFSLCVL